LWWIERDGGNAEDVAADIAGSLMQQGLHWYAQMTDLPRALQAVEQERDCFVKYARAFFLAKELGDTARTATYQELAESEARRIGQDVDPATWWASH
jgi:hypothetical protein